MIADRTCAKNDGEKYLNFSGNALLESFCQEELHLQNPTTNPNHQVCLSIVYVTRRYQKQDWGHFVIFRRFHCIRDETFVRLYVRFISF